MRATAAGSLPGDDFRGALLAMREALPEVLPLPELPDRGPTSAMAGRALGLIDGLGFDVQPAGWRLTAHPSGEHRRAMARWRGDLDDVEELLHGFDAVLKVAVAGPWSLAASVERPAGDKILADHGARRDLAQALAEAVTWLRDELARRVPAAEVWVQIDEPLLPAVADGAIPTASGFSRHPAVSPSEIAQALRPLADDALLHCCAPGAWLTHARQAGFAGASVDAALIDLDDLARWLDEDRRLVLGVVDTASAQPHGIDDLIRAALWPLRQAGITGPRADLLLGTACGLARWRHRDVLQQLGFLRQAADLVGEELARG